MFLRPAARGILAHSSRINAHASGIFLGFLKSQQRYSIHAKRLWRPLERPRTSETKPWCNLRLTKDRLHFGTSNETKDSSSSQIPRCSPLGFPLIWWDTFCRLQVRRSSAGAAAWSVRHCRGFSFFLLQTLTLTHDIQYSLLCLMASPSSKKCGSYPVGFELLEGDL